MEFDEHGMRPEALLPRPQRHGDDYADEPVRARIAGLLTGRCNNCYRRLPGEVGCSVKSPGWNWVTENFGPFCDDCFKEVDTCQVCKGSYEATGGRPFCQKCHLRAVGELPR